LLLFGIVTVLTLRASVFTPVPLVVAFLVITPMAAFQSARRTGVLCTGSAVGLVTGTAMFLFGAVLAGTLHLPHPPFGVFPFPLAVAVILGTIGAIFGKRFTGRPKLGEVTRLFAVEC
jgi:predicted lysophospholipase L1 biosynthesis ABC-type transport system permease subunit